MPKEDWNRTPNAKCAVCSKDIYIRPYRLNKGSRIGGWGCSKECSATLKKTAYLDSNNPKWSGGKTTDRGYKMSRVIGHPNASVDGYVYDHQLVIEEATGRYLNWYEPHHKDNEVVHHIDGDKQNNLLDNLALMTVASHNKLHRQFFSRVIKDLLDKGYLKWDSIIQEYTVE